MSARITLQKLTASACMVDAVSSRCGERSELAR